eukprot:3118047-Amphidinium_carterae.1
MHDVSKLMNGPPQFDKISRHHASHTLAAKHKPASWNVGGAARRAAVGLAASGMLECLATPLSSTRTRMQGAWSSV